jgi:hypothetical protein
MTTAEFCPCCGFLLRKSRSPKAHRLFFKVIEIACDNWPERYLRFRPRDREHLRAWLLCEAGHCDIVGERLRQDGGDSVRMGRLCDMILERMISNDVRYFFWDDKDPRNVVALVPRSIRFESLDEREFAPVREKVFGIIEEILGVPVDTLRREAKKM